MEGASCRSLVDIPRITIRGHPFSGQEGFTKEKIESSIDYAAGEGDLFLVTYPKSGTHWLLYIVYEILGMPWPTIEEAIKEAPFVEHVGAEGFIHLPCPRILRSHMPYRLIPKGPGAKYIYIIRNPYDLVVSYFNFVKTTGMADPEFDEFFDGFVSGAYVFGDYFEHMMSWYKQRNAPNVLVVSFDKMKLDPRNGLLEIAKFLGEEYFRRLKEDASLLEDIEKRTSFDSMKKQLSANKKQEKKAEANACPDIIQTALGNQPGSLFRKGAVGDYKNYLTEDHIRKMKMTIAEKLRDMEVEKFWEI